MNALHRIWIWLLCGVLIAVFGIFAVVLRTKKTSRDVADCPPRPETDAKKQSLLPAYQDKHDLAPLFEALLVRTGLEPDDARTQMVSLGILDAEAAGESTKNMVPSPSKERVSRKDCARQLEEAIRAGLKQARLNDDYSKVGIEHSPREPEEEFEVVLVDQDACQQVELYSKLITNLQEMLQLDEFPQNQNQVENLISALNDRALQAEQRMTHKTTMRTSEIGTKSERQFYSFMSGVVQHLRGKGIFPEIDALYRSGTTSSALDYKVHEAYALLKQRHQIFVALEETGMQKLLEASDAEIKSVVRRSLPKSSS